MSLAVIPHTAVFVKIILGSLLRDAGLIELSRLSAC